ncbi:MAG: hypothetical protein GEU71_08595 [Actinobacteria bacterium]|nr:hypothetical protein [Actinomycetota bacterium]
MEATAERPIPWRPFLGLTICTLFGWFAFVRGVNVPLLSLVDLGFHELGHLVTYPFPDLVTASMGSITQIAVPFGLAVYFATVRKDSLGFSFCLAWAATSAQNVSVYVADAPFQALPLIGGEHDWAFILGRLSHVDDAAAIAGAVEGIGMVFLAFAAGMCVLELWTTSPR